MRIISIRENPEYKEKAINYFSSKWSVPRIIYEDSIGHAIDSPNALPQWYLLEKEGQIIGSCGLITNDFISRMDLYPWACGLFIEPEYRGSALGSLLLERAKKDSRKAGFKFMYLSTDHIGYYEKYGFRYIGQGYHPWGEESRIYEISLEQNTDFTIRSEKREDWDEIYALIRTAFRTANVKDGDEQDYAIGLRDSERYIPELALVAEQDGKIIGHIMLTKTFISQPNGEKYPALLLSPLSVLLEYRDIGVGSALINKSCRLATKLGYDAVFLVGDPAYYSRLGFVKSSTFGIRSQTEIPEQYIQVKELRPGALHPIQGWVECM